MGIKKNLLKIKEKIIQSNLILKVSMIYNIVWAVCKIIFGAFTYSYFFCISGASTLLFGFTKRVYLKNFNNEDATEKKTKSIIILIMLIFSSLFFTIFMARLFFIQDDKSYGLILSIAIATCSFTELGISIYNFIKAQKSNDILLKSFKCCSLSQGLFAIVLTQTALFSATNTPASTNNALTGVIFGVLSITITIFVLTKAIKYPNQNL